MAPVDTPREQGGAPSVSQATTPVRPTQRIVFIDILRGFAVFGILVANMAAFSGRAGDLSAWGEPLDRAIVLLTRFLIQAKFYSLFSFLFGWGMAVQMQRAEAREARFVPLFVRRMLILLVISIAHVAQELRALGASPRR